MTLQGPVAVRSDPPRLVATGRSAGFSLVELMVAIAIGAVLMVGLVDLLIDTKGTYVREDQFARMQESARVATLLSSRQLRGNRSLGCRSLALATLEGRFNVKACKLLKTPAGTSCGHASWRDDGHVLLPDAALGYDNSTDLASAASYPDLPAAAASNIADRWLRGDVLVTWGVDGEGARVLGTLPEVTGTAGGFRGTGAIRIASRPDGIAGGQFALITDCYSADLFEISALDDVDLLVGHDVSDAYVDDADGSSDDTGAGGDLNATAALDRAYNWFDPVDRRRVAGAAYEARLFPFSYQVHYVCCVDTDAGDLQAGQTAVDRCRAGGSESDPGRYRPALCVWSAESEDTQVLLPEVADLRVTYTGDRNGDGRVDFRSADVDPIPTAARLTAWDAWRGVRSAALELLVTTEQDHVAPARRVPVHPSWPPNDGEGAVDPDTLGAGLPADGRFYERVVVNVTARASTPWYAAR